MPGSVEQGGFAEPVDSESESGDQFQRDGITWVRIKTPDFEGEAISLFDMNWQHVMDMMTTPGLLQMVKLAELLEMAVGAEGWSQIVAFGFSQMTEVLSDWTKKSQTSIPAMVISLTPPDEDE